MRSRSLVVVFEFPLLDPVGQFLKNFGIGDGRGDGVLPAKPSVKVDLPTPDTAKRQQGRFDADTGPLTDGAA
jgi:hypothetical protein